MADKGRSISFQNAMKAVGHAGFMRRGQFVLRSSQVGGEESWSRGTPLPTASDVNDAFSRTLSVANVSLTRCECSACSLTGQPQRKTDKRGLGLNCIGMPAHFEIFIESCS